jgi:hypothetical protein
MRGLLRDKDFLIVAGCLVVGILQVRAQRNLLRALLANPQAIPAPRSDAHRSHQPMRYSHPVLGDELHEGPLAAAFGMN